jgi:SET domain-containing protein
MLLVKTKLSPSKISGIGLFAEKFIPKLTIVWRNHTDSEMILTESQHDQLSDYMKEIFGFHGYFDKKTREWKLPLDNSRFMNHSDEPNLGQDEVGNNFALRDIHSGEELTCSYKEFDGTFREKMQS